MRPSRYDTPAVRVTVFLRDTVKREMTEAASTAGLSLGQFVDRLWTEGRAEAVKPVGRPPEKTVFVAHEPEVKGWGTICKRCGAVKGKIGWNTSCGSLASQRERE